MEYNEMLGKLNKLKKVIDVEVNDEFTNVSYNNPNHHQLHKIVCNQKNNLEWII